MGCQTSKAGRLKDRHPNERLSSSSCSRRQTHRTASEGRPPTGDAATLSGETPPGHELDSKREEAAEAIAKTSEKAQTQSVTVATSASALQGHNKEVTEIQTQEDISALYATILNDENPLEGLELDPPSDCESVVMKNGVRYRGDWRNGKQHGRGVQTQPDGVRYTGQFACGRIEGFGKLERPDGSKYEGEFNEGKAHTTSRSGVYFFSDGSKYIGQWVADRRHGIGKEIMVEGSVYEGQFKNGCKHGHGRMKSPNGDVYEGNFSKGDMNGHGRYCWPDGRVYEGEWSMSRMHGQGAFYFADGRIYTGEFQDSKMQNEGKLTWPDGSSYEGGFKGGLPHGRGIHKTAADEKGRVALWTQGVRVKWLDEEEEEEGAGRLAESRKASTEQQSRPTSRSEGTPARLEEMDNSTKQET